MQTISSILKVDGIDGSYVNEFGDRQSEAQIALGVKLRLEFDLRKKDLNNSEELIPVPIEELTCDGYYIVMDNDFDIETPVHLFKNSGIFVRSVNGRTLLSMEVPNTAVEGLVNYVNKNKQASMICELGGYNGDFESTNLVAEFKIQFNVVIRNSIYISGTIPPEVANDPNYLNSTQTKALIESKIQETLLLAKGETGSTGANGLSAYQIAVINGYTGSVTEWLNDLAGDSGLSAYQIAVDNGYNGTVSEWLRSLKGENGKGLQFDKTGTIYQKSLYDNEVMGFTFACTVNNEESKITTLYIYAKNSNAMADWCEPLIIHYYNENNVVTLKAIEFDPPKNNNAEYYALDTSSYPNATICNVSVVTSEGELILPYYSDFGVRKILKQGKSFYIYFGLNVPAYSKGKIYLTQMVGAPNVAGEPPIIEPEPPVTEKMYYGYLDGLSSVSDLTTLTDLTEIDLKSMDKFSVGFGSAGQVLAVVIPSSSPFVATKFNGINGDVPFAENAGATGAGANGNLITINEKDYKIYGEFILSTGERFIYVK